jgi:hypothetical protein
MPSYGTPRVVQIELIDDDGKKRICTATKHNRSNSNTPHWDLVLSHPSGQSWPAQFSGGNILDAVGELIERKEHEYNASRSRGHKPHPGLPDRNQRVDEFGNSMTAPVTMNGRDHRFGRR